MNELEFIKHLEAIDISLNSKQLQQFEKYYEILVSENAKYNLTAITDKKEVYYKHFFDSIATSQFFSFTNQKLCDVGSGAGFPSIPLRIVFPEIDVTIIDALNKRIKFLNILCDELALSDVKCIHARAEEFAVDNRASFDIVTARAVAALPVLSELCIPLIKKGGKFFVPKGSSGSDEKLAAKNAIRKLGCVEEASYSYELPFGYGERTLFVFSKEQATPKLYPRNFGQIKKKPL